MDNWLVERAEKLTGKILFIQNDETDPPHLVGRWLSEIGYEIEVIRADKNEKIPHQLPNDVSALIPLGGSMAAWEVERAPWLADEYKIIQDAYEKNIPILGLCLGAQLMAHALGGKVERGEVSEIGIYEIKNSGSDIDEIFNFPDPVKAALWHQDFITQLPAGAVRLASSDICANQIFRVQKNSYGLQFHPEIDAAIFQLWEEEELEEISGHDGSSRLKQVQEAESELFKTWRKAIQDWGHAVADANSER
jgi:GMP synthase-like glutamine amidotransferase